MICKAINRNTPFWRLDATLNAVILTASATIVACYTILLLVMMTTTSYLSGESEILMYLALPALCCAFVLGSDARKNRLM